MALSHKIVKDLSRQGFRLVAGVDEVGRGPLAGPILAAAVILPLNYKLPGLDDSKKLSPLKRERLYRQIKKQAIGIGLGSVSHKIIDDLGLTYANHLVMKRAVEALPIFPDFVLVDGRSTISSLSVPQRAIIGGDGKCASIAAASIIAKVTRDRLMLAYHKKFPLYGFNKHKGYGTPEHLQKLSEYGPCAIHRYSFTLTN